METTEELAHRFARETRPVILQRETDLSDSIDGFRSSSHYVGQASGLPVAMPLAPHEVLDSLAEPEAPQQSAQ